MTQDEILRLNEVTNSVVSGSKTKGLFPVSRSTWLRGVRSGLYPAPVRLSPRRVGWRRRDIETLIETLSEKGELDSHLKGESS
jgi:prophage regulatory protein